MASHTQLKGFNDINESLLSDQLEANIVTFFEWGLLNKGGFINITIPSSGAFGGAAHRLRLASEDPNYNNGQVWEGFRSNWVWESGLEYSRQPIKISGVYVDGNFYTPSSTGGYSHYVDYPNGRVVFNTAINPSSTVTCEYSSKLFHVSNSESAWWKEVQFNSYRYDNPMYLQQGSGAWSILGPNRIQLPHVIVEALPNVNRIPKEIGSEHFIVKQDVLFHILTETSWDKKLLHDIITYQMTKRMVGFDKNLMSNNDGFPLNYDGSLASGAKCYPDLVKATGDGGFAWKQIRIINMRSTEQPPVIAPLYYATVRGTFEIDLP